VRRRAPRKLESVKRVDPESVADLSRSGTPRNCGNCQHWDDGECMALARFIVPFWVKRQIEWTLAGEGERCGSFAAGTFRRAEIRARERRA
jgi:hypothetical protein